MKKIFDLSIERVKHLFSYRLRWEDGIARALRACLQIHLPKHLFSIPQARPAKKPLIQANLLSNSKLPLPSSITEMEEEINPSRITQYKMKEHRLATRKLKKVKKSDETSLTKEKVKLV